MNANEDVASPPGPAPSADGPAVIRRIGWLHFFNDLTLDFLTPLLPAGVGPAWLGVMEGIADGVGQVLKLFTGRASDRSGKRASWVAFGYQTNAIARPLAGIGMLLALPWWIVGCRIADRVGKGLRGSATDALVADWTDDQHRGRVFSRMRMMDHLGATIGGLAAALVTFLLPLEQLGWAVCSLVTIALLVVWLSRGLRDVPPTPSAAPHSSVTGWWPERGPVRAALLAIGIAGLASRISPLLVLVLVAGIPSTDHVGAWPLWQVCLGWAAFGLVQTAAAAVAGHFTDRVGAVTMLRCGWILLAAVCVGLGLSSGAWLIVAGLAFGMVTGVIEGVEKTWISLLIPKNQRGVSFGGLALVGAGAGLLGNGACGLWLAHYGTTVFFILAASAIIGAGLTWIVRLPASVAERR